MLVTEKELVIIKNEIPVISHIVIAEKTNNDKDSVSRLIRNYTEELENFWKVRFEIHAIKNSKNKINETKEYFLNEDQATFLMTLLKNTKEVVDFKLKLVLAFRNLKNIFSERMPKTLPEALRMYAEQLEKTEQLVLENKELERTKAWINNKKTATAMNTASRYAKINKELKIKLDNSKEYATVKRMELLYHWQKFNWRILKSTWIEMWIKPIEVFDANYGTVKAYHKDVWKEAYCLDII